MNKITFSSLILTAFISPFFAHAETATSTLPVSKPTFTSCSQEAVETRDTAISVARQAYNDTMKKALDSRKEGLKVALLFEETDAQSEAKKVIYDNYKVAQQKSQSTYSTTREAAWAMFDADMKACRDARKVANEKALAEKKIVKEKQKEEEKKVEAKKRADTAHASSTTSGTTTGR